MMSCRSPPLAVSASRIALRASSMLGSGGERRMPFVISSSAASEPSALAAERVDEALAQVPQRLDPDLAVGVDLGAADDLREVAERVAAGAGVRAARAGRGGIGGAAADRAVDRLGAGDVRLRVRRLAEVDVAADVGVVGLEPLTGQQVLGVPVAPRLAHRAGVRGVERADAVAVDDEAVRQAVRVLVPDRRGVVAEIVELREPVQVLEQVQLHRRRLAVGRRVHVRVVDVV